MQVDKQEAMAEDESLPLRWRPMGLDDIPKISDWFWDFGDVALFDRSLPVPVNIDTMRESWRASLISSTTPSAYWFIAESEGGEAAGVGGLQAVNYIHGDAVVPAFVARSFRGKGLATAMSVFLMDLAFLQLRLHRLTTYFRDDNTATRRALLTVGFREEGRFREGWFADGIRRDVILAGVLGSEWAAARDEVIGSLARNCKVSLNGGSWAPAHD